MSSGGGRKKKGGHEEHEEHVNHERWLVSYADMLTLLFVLFVVLYSMSSVDQKKFAELAVGLSEGFGGSSAALTGNVSNLDGGGQSTTVVPIDPGTNPGDGGSGTAGMTKEQKEAVQRALLAASRKEASANAKAATKEAENLKEIERKIADALDAAKLLNRVKFTINERGLVVTVVTNEVVFAGNRAELRSGGRKMSAARASTTVRYLIGHGLPKNRMSAVGFSDTKPLIDPKDPRAVTMNRRVDVVVLTMLNAEQAALLPAAAGGDAKLHTGTTTKQAAADAKAKAGTTESTSESPTTPHD
jgi:chemotaxis protein MotB